VFSYDCIWISRLFWLAFTRSKKTSIQPCKPWNTTLKWKVSNQRRNVLSNEKYENCPCNEIIFSKKKLVHVKNFKKIVSNWRVAHWIAPRPTPTKGNHHIHVHGHWSHCFGIANARNHIHSQHNVANGSRLVLVNLSIDTSLKKSNIILRYKDCGYGSEWVF
jgi:hypothetical protein